MSLKERVRAMETVRARVMMKVMENERKGEKGTYLA